MEIRHLSTSAPAPKDRSENAYLEGPGAPGKFYLTQNRCPGPENNKNPQPGHGHGRAPTRPPPSRSGLRLGVRTDEGQQTTTAKGQKVVSNGGHGGSNFFRINGTRGGGARRPPRHSPPAPRETVRCLASLSCDATCAPLPALKKTPVPSRCPVGGFVRVEIGSRGHREPQLRRTCRRTPGEARRAAGCLSGSAFFAHCPLRRRTSLPQRASPPAP